MNDDSTYAKSGDVVFHGVKHYEDDMVAAYPQVVCSFGIAMPVAIKMFNGRVFIVFDNGTAREYSHPRYVDTKDVVE